MSVAVVVVALGIGCAAQTSQVDQGHVRPTAAPATDARTTAPTKGKLVVGILTVESSYGQDLERPAQGVPDTVQFWIGPEGLWRIRTYAIDHDIHPHSLGDGGNVKDNPTEFARAHIGKSYGDVLASIVVLEFPDTGDPAATRRILADHAMKGSLEVAKVGFAFWNPDDGTYRTQTKPK